MPSSPATALAHAAGPKDCLGDLAKRPAQGAEAGPQEDQGHQEEVAGTRACVGLQANGRPCTRGAMSGYSLCAACAAAAEAYEAD